MIKLILVLTFLNFDNLKYQKEGLIFYLHLLHGHVVLNKNKVAEPLMLQAIFPLMHVFKRNFI